MFRLGFLQARRAMSGMSSQAKSDAPRPTSPVLGLDFQGWHLSWSCSRSWRTGLGSSIWTLYRTAMDGRIGDDSTCRRHFMSWDGGEA